MSDLGTRTVLQRKTATPPGAVAVDLVNHPPHYTNHPSGVECITVVEHMGFNLGNAIKIPGVERWGAVRHHGRDTH